MSLTAGSEEVAEFLRNYTLPPKALHKLHHLQVSSEAFTQQPAEILRLLGFMNELEIHNIVSDWREYSSTGYSPSYIDRLLDEFHQPNVLTDPSDDLTLSFSASFLDIPEAIAEEIPTETSVVPPKSVSFAPSPIVEKPKAEPASSVSSTKTEPLTSDPPAPAPSPAATNATTSITTAAPAKATTQVAKDKPDLTDIIRELRALVDQRTVENDYLRLQNNSHVEDVERRAREYKELRDEYNQWKKTARETESKLRHTESLHQLTLAELEEAQKALGKKHTQLMRLQEELQEQHLLSSDLEQEIFSLRKVIAGRKGIDVEIQSDQAMTRNTWTLIRGESVSIEPVEPTTVPPATAVDIVLAIASSHDAIDRLQVSHINEEDDRLMSGDVGDTIGEGGDDEDDEVERGISLHDGSNRDEDRDGDRDSAGGNDDDDVVSTHQSSVVVVETTDVGMNTDPLVSFDAETDTHDLHNDDDEDFKPTSSRITVAKKGGGKVIQDPWPNLSYAQLLDKYRTLEEESTEWQKKQYQELIDAQSEVRRLEVVLVEQHEEANLYKERYEKLLVSSISEINETVMQEKAESAEVIATLQQQREGYLAKIAHLQASLAERDAVIEEKDREIQRLRRLLQGPGAGSAASAADTPPLSSRLPPNITEGRAIEVAQSTNTAGSAGGSGEASVETWSRERVKEKLAHEEVQEKHRWEEKEKLYLMNMDHLSASLKELTAVFHQQQEQLHQLLPPIHKDNPYQLQQDGALADVIESRSNNYNNGTDFDPKATSFSDPGAGATALVSRGRPVPPGANNGSTTQPLRPKTSHGPILSMGTAAALSSSEGTGGHSSMKGRAFQHRHRALKAAVKTSIDGSISPPRLMVVDANGSPQRVEQRQQYPDALYYVDDEGSDDGHVVFVEHQEEEEEERQRSPTTLTHHERKQLEKEEKDRLLAKAYDPESLRRIYFHPANKAGPPQRPSTGGALKGPTSGGGGGGRPSTGNNNNRPSSSFGYKPQQKATTGKKHEKPRPRASLVANFIQGLELRYHEDLARMIQLQQEQDGPFYEHLAQAVGQPQPQQPSIPRQPQQPQQPQQQERRSRPVAAAVTTDPALYPEMQYYYPQYPVPTTSSYAYSSSKGGHQNQHQSQPRDPPAQITSAVGDIDEEEAARRGHRGGGFFITVVPSSNTDPSGQRRSPRVVPNLPPSSTATTVVATAAGAGPTEPITEFSLPEQSQPQRPQQPVARDDMNARVQKKFSKPKKPPSSSTANPNVSLPPQVMDIEQQQQQQQQQQPLPPQETLVVVTTPPRRRSRGNDAGPTQHHPTDGEVPLTSYPMMTTMHSQHSISSVGSSSGHSSMAPSQFSSPSMVLHPSNSQPTDAFLLLLHQDSLRQDSLPHPHHPHHPQHPQQEQQIPEIVFHQHHGLRALNRSSSASY